MRGGLRCRPSRIRRRERGPHGFGGKGRRRLGDGRRELLFQVGERLLRLRAELRGFRDGRAAVGARRRPFRLDRLPASGALAEFTHHLLEFGDVLVEPFTGFLFRQFARPSVDILLRFARRLQTLIYAPTGGAAER